MTRPTAVNIKKAFIAQLQLDPAMAAELTGRDPVQVLYNLDVRDKARQCIYTGKATWQDSTAGGGERPSRMRQLTFGVIIEVRMPGSTAEESDARAQELGVLLEDFVATNFNGEVLGIDRVMRMVIAGGSLEGGYDDDGALSVANYQVVTGSHQL